VNEGVASKILFAIDRKLDDIDQAYEEGRWLKNQGRLSAEDQNSLETRRAACLLDPALRDIIAEYKGHAQDPILNRLISVFERLVLSAQIESDITIYPLRTEIEQLIINYPMIVRGQPVTRTDLREILRKESDPGLRKEASSCFDDLSRQLAPLLVQLIKSRNELAQKLGYANYAVLALFLQGLDRSSLSQWFDALLQKTDDIYSKFLDESRQNLGQDRLHSQDLDYALSSFKTPPDEYFSRRNLISSIQLLAKEIGLAEALETIRIDFVDIPWQGLCVTVHGPEDIRILMNPSDGHVFYPTFFHEVGHGMHWHHIQQELHVFNDEPGPFCEGMADTMARFVDDYDWLRKYSGMPDDLARQSVSNWPHRVNLQIRKQIGLAEFEWQMYTTRSDDYLDIYRSVMSRCLGVSYQKIEAWADNMFWTSYPFYVQNYVLSEMIASQTHASLKNTFGRALHSQSGVWLIQNYWSPGGSIEWSDKIKIATGIPLSPYQLIRDINTPPLS